MAGNRTFILLAGITLSGLPVAARSADGGHGEIARTHPPVCRCIPVSPYSNYGTFSTSSRTAMLLRSTADQPVIYQGADEVAIAVRNFYPAPPRLFLETEGLILDRPAVAITDEGFVEATARLTFNGGPDAALLGAYAYISVRAYTGDAGTEHSALIYESSRHVFVRTSEEITVSLIGDATQRTTRQFQAVAPIPPNIQAPALAWRKLDFQRITQIEIVLEYQRAR